MLFDVGCGQEPFSHVNGWLGGVHVIDVMLQWKLDFHSYSMWMNENGTSGAYINTNVVCLSEKNFMHFS